MLVSANTNPLHNTHPFNTSAPTVINFEPDANDSITKKLEVIEILRNIHKKVKKNPSNVLTVLSDTNALSDGIVTESGSQNTQTKISIFKNESAWIIPAQVNYCAETYQGVNFFHDDAPKLSLLGAALRNGYLHTAIREKGGAYGAGAMHDSSSGVFKFFSYRDPTVSYTHLTLPTNHDV